MHSLSGWTEQVTGGWTEASPDGESQCLCGAVPGLPVSPAALLAERPSHPLLRLRRLICQSSV